MNTNSNNNVPFPSSSSPTSSKGKKPLSDITNTVLSASPPRNSASSTVAGSSRPSAQPATPIVKQAPLVSKDVPHEPAPVEPFHIDTYRSDVWQQWRRMVAALNDLTPHLSNQYLAPEAYERYYRHYEQVLDRERTLFAELTRLTVPTPGPPVQEDPNLVAIHTAWSVNTTAHQAAWSTYNSTQQAAWSSYQESQRQSWVAYREALSAWAQLKK
ncbi:hypothetical protein BG015_005235 [Linnemannia schmuckeri]|uniref:Uncharacterized protein n=1 Tax=Linnemannia schmuckeri TaxID=64567 RepID=A0A9P5R6L8_9FUNG|nr:hypothetical protein BG015_005235 [Linnemannia schmuckeri]